MSENLHPSVLLNKISKANKMITEYAGESPGDYGREPHAIAESLAAWTAQRDRLVATYRSL